MGIVIVLHLELREKVICREEHPVHDRGGGLSAGSGGIPLGRRGVGSAVPFSSRGGGRGAKVPAADHPTHQWRGDTPEKPMEAFLARDGHQRVQGGAVSGVWRWVLESVFHLMTNGQSEEERKEKTKEGPPVSKGNPTTRPEMPAAVPARKSSVGSSFFFSAGTVMMLAGSVGRAPFPSSGETDVDIKRGSTTFQQRHSQSLLIPSPFRCTCLFSQLIAAAARLCFLSYH